ncbi:tetratricopeptide repeat protein [Terriglobus sp. 2YAB30_2]|uniref:tetratricopeptide repeat protein n=1 Tax=unclassified Terriglobus TaxID=2628988 RepID=UPI003F974336
MNPRSFFRFEHSRWRIAAAGLALLAGAAGILLSRAASSRDHQQYANGYVAPQSCNRCHAKIAETYSQTGMGRSFHRVSLQTEAADFKARNNVIHQSSGKRYEMVQQDGAFYLRRSVLNQDPGQEIENYTQRMDYAIGSGNHARTYLHRTTDGKLIELPVSWYTELGGYWAMSPGYDQAAQMDVHRAIGKDCMFCHNGYPSSDPGSGSLSDGAIFAEQLPEGIDCQRCHGPGAAHVKAASAWFANKEKVRSTIVNPAHLPRERQMDVCRQCHLETTSLPLPNGIRRYDRTAYSFKPGEPLQDFEIAFDHAPGSELKDRFEVAHQAYRLQKSKCYLKSDMTCITCHNPHRPQRGEAGAAQYRAVCLGCHQAEHPRLATATVTRDSDCLGCHMGKRRTEDAVHVVMTDHFIQRYKPKGDLLAPIQETIPAYQGEVAAYDPRLLSEMPEGNLYYAVAQVAAGSNLKQGIPLLQHALEVKKPQYAGFYFALAAAQARAGNDAEAIHWYDEAIKQPDHTPAMLREQAAALARLHQLPQALQVAGNAIDAAPNDAVAYTTLGNIQLQAGNVQQAQQALDHALSLDPEMADAQNLMGLTYTRLSKPDDAARSLRKALQIDPGLTEAKINLAVLLADRGDMEKAEAAMQSLLRTNPESADLHHRYALVLASSKQWAKAAEQMQQAIHIEPRSAIQYADLGDIFVAAGKIDAAAAPYRQAIALDARQLKAHLGLASILMAQNKSTAAEDEYRLAAAASPQNGEVHLALADLALRRGSPGEARQQLELALKSDDPSARQMAYRLLSGQR